ncbi:Phospholipase_D-nuclease N-terminal [Cohaesibacter sp. ES.047]|uniref:PLD nuclease N-terminal domain-containing protein n=1 Tax=Cohaesibacter sp. ES.047 TaxID=1798205 RepID=UPI000BB70D59|nr:PLD nuclease N-terminal domain-containing protein [Cohaesibacter sp. ES.047]SNY91304.1 Phospholipase_D-nuclease N-terminal [Cohaesibacter sp. ES.047]
MYGYSLLGLLILIADIYAIIKTLQSGASTGAKLLWVLGILIFPVIGVIVWYFAGPSGGRSVRI